MYEAMGMMPQELEETEALGFMGILPPMMLVSLVARVGFYIWPGRYFEADPGAPSSP